MQEVREIINKVMIKNYTEIVTDLQFSTLAWQRRIQDPVKDLRWSILQ